MRNSIKELQVALNSAGAKDSDGKELKVDGEIGPKTESAWKQMQGMMNMSPHTSSKDRFGFGTEIPYDLEGELERFGPQVRLMLGGMLEDRDEKAFNEKYGDGSPQSGGQGYMNASHWNPDDYSEKYEELFDNYLKTTPNAAGNWPSTFKDANQVYFKEGDGQFQPPVHVYGKRKKG